MGIFMEMSKDIINGLKQPGLTYYVNALENMISLCYGDISITHISFKYNIPMQILMKIVFLKYLNDFWRVLIFKVIIAFWLHLKAKLVAIWCFKRDFDNRLRLEIVMKYLFKSMAIHFMLHLFIWLLIPVSNARCVYVKSWCNVMNKR